MNYELRKRKKSPKYLKVRLSYLDLFFFSDPLGVRTQDPHIKSVMLYRLS